MARAAAARAQPAQKQARSRAKAATSRSGSASGAAARPRPKPASRPAPRRRVAGGVFWIGAVALFLAGVVALNVAVLRLNVRFEELGRERAGLRADNAELASEIAARAASGRIATLASGRGLVPAGPEDWTYLDLRR